MSNPEKITMLVFAIVVVVVGLTLHTTAGQTANLAPAKVTSVTPRAHLRATEKPSLVAPAPGNPSSPTHTTVTTSGNCTKSVSNDKQQTQAGETSTVKTSVNCSSQGGTSSTSVNISSSQQTSSSGGSSDQSGNASNNSQSDVQVHIN